MRKLSEVELLKYWLDSEITIIHAMLAGLAIMITDRWWVDMLLGFYIIFSIVYAAVRAAIVNAQQKDYLKVPK